MSIRKKLFSQQLEQEQNEVFLIMIKNPVHQKTKFTLDEISQRVKKIKKSGSTSPDIEPLILFRNRISWQNQIYFHH